jgi:hypothetical protein
MEVAFIFIMFGIAFGLSLLLDKLTVNTRVRCNELGVRHVWVKEGTGDNFYIVCEKCKVHLVELANNKDGGSDD